MILKNWAVVVVLAILLLLGVFFRAYQLGSIPQSLYWDEVAMLVDTKSIVANGTDMHGRTIWQFIFPSYGDYKLPVYIWLASVTAYVFGPSAFSLRLVSFIAGTATIVLAGYCAKRLNQLAKLELPDTLVFISTMIVVALSPWAILFSRTAFEGHLAQFFFGLSIAALLWKPTTLKSIPVSVLLGITATYTYYSVRFVWPVVFAIVWIWLLALHEKPIFFKNFPKFLSHKVVYGILGLLAGLSAFGLLLIPMTKADFYAESQQIRLSTPSVLNNDQVVHVSNAYKLHSGGTIADKVFFHRYWLMIRELLFNYSDHLRFDFLFLTGDANLRHSTTRHGLFLLSMAPFFLVGLVWVGKKNIWLLLVLLAWWMAALLPASVPETTPHALRSLNALIPLSILIGLGLALSYQWLKDLVSQRAFTITFYALIFIFFIESTAFGVDLLYLYPQRSAKAWNVGNAEAARFVEAHPKVARKFLINLDTVWFLWRLAEPTFDATRIPELESDRFRLQLPDVSYQLPNPDDFYQVGGSKLILAPAKELEKIKNDPRFEEKMLTRLDFECSGEPCEAIIVYE